MTWNGPAYDKAWRAKNPESFRRSQRKYNASAHGIAQRRKRMLEKKYGMTAEQYDELVKKQGNRCAVCGIHQMELGKRFDVDHCHSTNTVRGLLCNSCNQALGLFKDKMDIIKRALNYLKGESDG